MRKVLIDCVQNIPCNPCVAACLQGAITIPEGLTQQPEVDTEKCNGCASCIAACPGQACFVVDTDFAGGEGSVDIPYEYLPYPAEGEEVLATDNEGEILCTARVVKVTCAKKNNRTAVVRMAVPLEFTLLVRGLVKPAAGD